MGSRTWVKLYCSKWIEGSIRNETPLVRAVFIDLIALAGSGEYGDIGRIGLKNGVGLTNKQFMTLLSLSKNQWIYAKNRLQKTGRIAYDPQNNITILNWNKYQSEYQRQRPYRLEPRVESYNQKLQPKVTQEKEIEKEKEIPVGAAKKQSTPQSVLGQYKGLVTLILNEMKAYLGYPGKTDKDPIPSYGKEGQAIKRMLARGFTHEEILACWKGKVAERVGDFVSMTWVNEDIGKTGRQSAARRQSSTKLPPRDEYHLPYESAEEHRARMQRRDTRKITTDEDRRRGLA